MTHFSKTSESIFASVFLQTEFQQNSEFVQKNSSNGIGKIYTFLFQKRKKVKPHTNLLGFLQIRLFKLGNVIFA